MFIAVYMQPSGVFLVVPVADKNPSPLWNKEPLLIISTPTNKENVEVDKALFTLLKGDWGSDETPAFVFADILTAVFKEGIKWERQRKCTKLD